MQIFSSKRSFHFFIGVLVILSVVQSIGVMSRAQAFALDGFLKDYFRKEEPSLDDPPPDPYPTKLPPPTSNNDDGENPTHGAPNAPSEPEGGDMPNGEPDRPGNESYGAPDLRRAVPVRPWNPCQGEVEALNACIIRVSRPNDREQIR